MIKFLLGSIVTIYAYRKLLEYQSLHPYLIPETGRQVVQIENRP